MSDQLTKCQNERGEREGVKPHDVWIVVNPKVIEIRTGGKLEGEILAGLPHRRANSDHLRSVFISLR